MLGWACMGCLADLGTVVYYDVCDLRLCFCGLIRLGLLCFVALGFIWDALMVSKL